MNGTVTLTIRQFRRATFKAVNSSQPALIRVFAGTKRVRTSLGAMDVGAGGVAVLVPRLDMTIENCPAPDGPYQAQLMVIPEDLVGCTDRADGDTGNPMRATTRERVVAAFDRSAAFARAPAVPERIRLNAVREVLLWLAEEGIGFGRLRPPLLADRLRAILSADPGREWRSAEAAEMLAVSEPTLRRQLAQNGASFGVLLADVRMSVALGMLQSSDLPVNRVALDVGYACPSRFAVRFRKRFGLAPSSIRMAATQGDDRASRDAAPAFDRIGTKNDRSGTIPVVSEA